MAVAYATVGFRVTLLTAIGLYLESKGVGKWSTTAGAADTAITVSGLPSTPDRAVSMTLYTVEDTAGTDSIMGLQLRFRGPANNRSAVLNIIDQAFDALHGVEHTTWGGIPIVRVDHRSGAELGPDSSNRVEHSENYYIKLIRSGTHRSD
jgi:hypothetical protein